MELPIATSPPTYTKIPIAPKTRLGCFQMESLTFWPMWCSAASILGSLKDAMATASSSKASAKKYTYSLTTASASSPGAMAEVDVPRMSRAPIQGKIAVPKELKACDKFNRLEAVQAGPRTATYG